MQEIFHKPAKQEWRSQLRRSGVISATSFSDSSELRAYSPSPELSSRISHYWILRWSLPEGTIYRPTEILSAPVVNLFFTQPESFLYGLSPALLEYEARNGDRIAGVTFLPGGFAPYWKTSLAKLPRGRSPLGEAFPSMTSEYCRDLLQTPQDRDLAAKIDTLFLSLPAQDGLHQQTILEIIRRVDSDPELRTVAAVSQAFRIPERSLQHIFRTEVGTSLKWVLLRARLLEAVSASYDQEKTDWSEVALRSGYSSQAHFITDFKRVFAVSPGRFHQHYQG